MESTFQDAALFNSTFLRRLEQLALRTRRRFTGEQRAERRARQLGSSLDFADYRNYSPGDDLRNVDWNLYGRLDRLYVKLFEEEQDLSIYLLLDTSASMRWTPQPGALSKLDQARRLAAALAYIGLANLDRVNVLTFSATLGEETGFLRGKGQFNQALTFLRELAPGRPGATSLLAVARAFAQRRKRRGLVFVLSDFYDPQGYEAALALLQHQQFEVQAVQIADPAELDPSLKGDLRLDEIETDDRLEITIDPALQRAYRTAVQKFLADLQTFCRRRQMGFAHATTATPFDDLVLKLLRQSGLVQ